MSHCQWHTYWYDNLTRDRIRLCAFRKGERLSKARLEVVGGFAMRSAKTRRKKKRENSNDRCFFFFLLQISNANRNNIV